MIILLARVATLLNFTVVWLMLIRMKEQGRGTDRGGGEGKRERKKEDEKKKEKKREKRYKESKTTIIEKIH